MQKIKIRLPATIVGLGPCLHGVSLALGMHCTVEVMPRKDEALTVDAVGEGAGFYPLGFRHPVVLAMARVFQQLERALMGVQIRIDNQIPPSSGLGLESALAAGGAIAANNLMGSPLPREHALALTAALARIDSTVGAVDGGLTLSHLHDETLIHRTLPIAPLTVVIVLPQVERYPHPSLGERIATADVFANMARSALLLEALKHGDLALLAQTLQDDVFLPQVLPQIPAYRAAADAARDAGAVAVTPAGEGPSIVAFAESKHHTIAQEMVAAMGYAGVKARAWVLPVDRQGITVSAMG